MNFLFLFRSVFNNASAEDRQIDLLLDAVIVKDEAFGKPRRKGTDLALLLGFPKKRAGDGGIGAFIQVKDADHALFFDKSVVFKGKVGVFTLRKPFDTDLFQL